MTIGDHISRYLITGRIGQGGMGVVYKAEDTRLNRPVALKFLPPDSLEDHDRKRLVNEAQAAALIRHPNVCPIYDVEEADGQSFIAMAWLDGETLERRIARGPLPIPTAIDIAIQIAGGLDAAHALGIIHRDIKSGNVLVNVDGHASILDFGLALRPGATRITAPGHAAGTPAYMSPEQVRGLAIDRRTDLWSLGVLLFEMVAGVVPFKRDHQAAVTHAIAFDDPPTVSSLRPDVSPALQSVIETALAKSPDRRWQSAREMGAALRRIQGVSGSHESTSSSLMTRTMLSPVALPNRKRYAAVAGILVCAAAGAGYSYFRGHSSAPPAIARPASDLGKQIAVLPFQLGGGGSNARTVSDGLMEVMTEAISDFDNSQRKLMPVPASEILRRNIATVADARRIYGVDLAITGSAETRGSTLHCALQLVNAATSQQIGAAEFDYDPANPRQAKNRAIEQVAGMLGVNSGSAGRAGTPDSAKPGAYSPYLEGRGFLARYDVRGNLEKAVASFRRAVALDPDFTLAWAALGETYWRQARANGDKQTAALAVESAERAVQLDPSLAIAHSALGAIYGASGREEDGIRELKQALTLGPGNAEAPRELARIYANLGRFAEAEASYLKAIQSRPTDWYGYLLLGLFYQSRERYKEGESAFRRALEFAPGNDIAARNLAVAYSQSGSYAEAIEVLQNSLKIRPNANTYAALAATYYYQHRFQEAASAVETAIDLDSSRYPYWGNAGIYYKWIPDARNKVAPALHRAIELAEKSLEITPTKYDVRADLAEYQARLGDSRAALAEIARIPESARKALASRLALGYELTGNRNQAIELIRSRLTNSATLNQIKDDPDLAGLWADPAFQKALPPAMRR